MDVRRYLLLAALVCAPMHAAAAAAVPPKLQDARSPALWPAGGTVDIRLEGALASPGDVRLPAAEATLARVLAAAGGASRDSYPLATLLLRRAGSDVDFAGCAPIAVWHASLLLQDDPKLGKRTDLVAQLLSGQLTRVDAGDRVANEPGVRAALLQDGDLLALPGRSSVVYVATAQGAIVRMSHNPAAPAEFYVEQLPKADRRGGGEFALHYPNGQHIELKLDAWHYRPTMVPPGSLIAPDSVCLKGE